MTRRRWVRGWLLRSLVMGVFFSLWDVGKWIAHGRLPGADREVHTLLMALVLGGLFALPMTAWYVYILTWVASLVLGMVVINGLEKSTSLSPTAASTIEGVGEYLPILIGLGAVALWLRTQRNKRPGVPEEKP